MPNIPPDSVQNDCRLSLATLNGVTLATLFGVFFQIGVQLFLRNLIGAGMIFAHWKKRGALTGGSIAGPGCQHYRYEDRVEVVEHFIVDIPEGTTKNDVVEKLLGKLFACRGRSCPIDETDGLGFEEEWPPAVLRQFKANDPTKRWPWSRL